MNSSFINLKSSLKVHAAAVWYALLWLVYLASTFLLFPALNTSVIIPVIPIIGLGAWLFGTSAGLYSCLLSLFHNYLLTGVVYAESAAFYQHLFGGAVLLPATAILVGRLRRNSDAIRELNQQLQDQIATRSTELSVLTEALLQDSENLKIHRSQKLHDGIGQQLTGIQLLASSLHDHLLTETDPLAALADHLRNRTGAVHIKVRRISRMLFPIRISQVGLTPALRELASSVRELKNVQLKIDEPDLPVNWPDLVSLQLYRICQETALHAIDHLQADRLAIRLSESETACVVHLSHNGKSGAEQESTPLIGYRLKRISGTVSRRVDSSGRTVSEFRCSRPANAEGVKP